MDYNKSTTVFFKSKKFRTFASKAGIEFKLLKNYPDLKILKIAYSGERKKLKFFKSSKAGRIRTAL